MKIGGSFRNVGSEPVVLKTLRKCFSKDGVDEFADVKRLQREETCDCNANGDIVLTFEKRA